MNETIKTVDLNKNWGWFMAMGIVMLVGGCLALYAPFTASLAVETAVGLAFLVGGGIALVQIFRTKDGWGARGAYLLMGLLNLAAGALLLVWPLEGLMALTLFMAVAIMVNGGMRIITGIQMRPDDGWGWAVASGVISLLAGGMIFTQYPEISLVLLGIFAGVSLLVDGISYVVFSLALKSGKDASVPA